LPLAAKEWMAFRIVPVSGKTYAENAVRAARKSNHY